MESTAPSITVWLLKACLLTQTRTHFFFFASLPMMDLFSCIFINLHIVDLA